MNRWIMATVALLTACATTPEDSDAPMACLVIDNTRAGGAAGRVFLVSHTRARTRLSEVPMGQKVRECIRRTTFTGEYRLLIEQAPADRMDPALRMNQPDARESPPFFLRPDLEVVWDVNGNQIYMNPGGAKGEVG